MAKPGRTNRKEPDAKAVNPAVADTAAATIATIRKYYNFGKRARDVFPEGAKQDSRTIRQLATEAGVSPDLIRKARVFARLYDEPALEDLLRLRTPVGMPLSWSHIRHLLTVENAARRAELARQAAEAGWKIRELKDAAEALRGGPRSRGGRRRRKPLTPAANLLRLIQLGESLRRFWEDIEGEALRAWVVGPSDHDASAEIGSLAQRAVAKLGEVEAMARRAGKRLQQAAGSEGQPSGGPGTTPADPGKAKPASKASSRRPLR
jgi:hypothetical protein